MNNNNKKRIFIAIIFIILLFLLMTFAGGNSEVAIVEFIDGFDNSTISTQEVEIGEDAEVPEDPYHKNYVFAGWYLFEDHDIKVKDFTNIEEDLKVIALYAGDRNNNGKADEDEETFTVKFVDGVTEDVIKTEDVLVGMDATAPEAPAHRGYTFVGWDKGYTNIQANTTVTAEYRREVVEATMYTVTFVDGDTQEVITTQRVEEGNAATLPEAPKHENRVFKEWTGNYTNVTSNRTITAIYTDDKNNDGIDDETQPHYDVTYYDYNDEVIEVIEDVLVDMPTPTIANPEREHYTFEGWEPELAETVTDNTDYKATYAPINDENGNNIADEEEEHFTITYVDYNNEPIKVFEDVLVGLETPTIDNPTREYYTFAGWNPTVAEKVTADAEYKATYTINNDVDGDQVPDELEEKWTVTYKITDKEVYKTFENLVDGITTPKVDNPTRDNYTFVKWNPEVKATVEANDVYVAEWKANTDENGNNIADEEEEHFTITYKADGNVFKTFENVLVGLATPVPTEKPTKTNYVFVNWGTVAEKVTADATYNAVWADDKNNNGEVDSTEEHFTITYVDYNNEPIKVFEDVLVGLETPTIDNPTREYYTFAGWNPTVAPTVTADATYTATYTINNDVDGDKVPDELEEKWTVTYKITDKEVYKTFENLVDGIATPKVDNPTRTNYTFVKWNPAVSATVTANAEYVAEWKANTDENGNNIADEEEEHYDIVYYDHEGNEIKTFRDVLVGLETPKVDAPVRDYYTFAGWAPEVAPIVTADAEYKATYTINNDVDGDQVPDELEEKWIVTYKITENEVYKTFENLVDGITTPKVDNPTRTNYTFVKWNPEVKATVEANDVYVAEWKANTDENGNNIADEEEAHYDITYVDHENNVIKKFEDVLVGLETPSIPNPTRDYYTFAGWAPEVAPIVTADAEYKATYTINNDVDGDKVPDELEEKWTVTYKITDKEVYKTFENLVDGIATPKVDNPTRNNYTFVKWNPEVKATVEANDVYVAEWKANNDQNNDGIADEEQEKFTVVYNDYDGKELYTEKVLINMPTPSIPNPTRQYYTFAGWTPTVAPTVTADATYTATYTINNDVDGDKVPDELEEKWTVTYKITDKEVYKTFENLVDGIATPKVDNPTRDNYTFVKWNPEVKATVEANDVYVAEWKANNDQNNDGIADEEQEKFTVVYNDYDGKELYTEKVLINMPTPSIPNPTRQYYTFAGWTPTVAEKVTADATYTATYTINNDVDGDKVPDELEEKWTVTYKITDKEVYKTFENLVDGIATPKVDNPTRTNYTFVKWNPAVSATVTANAEYVAEWKANTDENGNNIADEEEEHFTITYVDYNNEPIKVFEDILVGLETPTIDNPTREYYTFAGWNPTVAPTVTADAEYKATYTIDNDKNNDGIPDETQAHYDITYVDYDGEEIETIEDVLVDMPTPKIANPTRKYYTFIGWTPAVAEKVTADATYTATYKANNDENKDGIADEEQEKFTVIYKDYNGENLYTGEVLINMPTPSIPNPTRQYYTFAEWTPTVAEKVTADATYTATYTINNDVDGDKVPDELEEKWTVTYKITDKEVYKTFENLVDGIATPKVDEPTRNYYTFNGWNPEVKATVEANDVYVAKWIANTDENGNNIADEEEAHYDITYVDHENNVIKKFEDVLVGLETPTIDNPTRQYYTFAGWTPAVAEKVTAEATYKATWTATNDVDGDGTPDELEEKWTVTYKITEDEVYKTIENLVDGIATPKVDEPTRNYYTFNGWNPEVKATVEANDVYVAKWIANTDENGNNIADEEEAHYDITYVDHEDNVIEKFEDVLVGLETPTIDNPTRQYYTFAGWTPAVAEKVTAEATYKATWTVTNDADGDGTPDELEEKWTVTYKITEDEVYKTFENLVDGIATPKVDEPTRNYYTFNGWNPEVKATVEANDVYVAKWIANTDENGNNIADEEEAHYDITYVDHEDNVIEKFEDVLVGLETPTIDNPTREYYTFAGWTPAVAEKVTAEATYKATWTADEDKNDDNIADQEQDLVVVKFYGKDNTTVISTQWIIRGEDATAPTPQTVKGFAFVKWLQTYTNVTVDELNVYAEYKDVEAPVVESNVTLYNQKDGEYYNANIKFTVTDNVGVSEVRYAKGNLDENYYSNAEQISKYEINGISENGIYTIFAKDEAGNISVHHVEVSGISLTEGTFEDLFAEYELGKRTNGWIDGNDKYSQKVTITPLEGKTIVDARIYKDTGFLGLAPSYANLSDFTSNVDANGKSTFGSALDYSGNKIEYTLESAVTSRFTIYVKYAYQVETAPGVYETRYETKLYKVRLAKYLAQ